MKDELSLIRVGKQTVMSELTEMNSTIFSAAYERSYKNVYSLHMLF